MTDVLANPYLVAECVLLLIVAVVLGRRIELKIGSLHAELRPNGGSSTRDAVDRVEAKVDAHAARMESKLDALTDRVSILENQGGASAHDG